VVLQQQMKISSCTATTWWWFLQSTLMEKAINQLGMNRQKRQAATRIIHPFHRWSITKIHLSLLFVSDNCLPQ
jgi:hypothetical protein